MDFQRRWEQLLQIAEKISKFVIYVFVLALVSFSMMKETENFAAQKSPRSGMGNSLSEETETHNAANARPQFIIFGGESQINTNALVNHTEIWRQ